jgi:hypothetical protein
LSIFTSAADITKEEQIITFSDISRTDRSIVLSIPSNAEVSRFSFGLSGPERPGREQPWNLTLDIGDNGTIDWALKPEYGPLGFQNLFGNGREQLGLRFIPGNHNNSGNIYLPISAEIERAQMKLKFEEEHYISPVITELNRAEWHPEAPYDYDPEFCVFQDRLYVAYRSYSWRDSNQSDADIVINSTADGVNWQDRTIELSKAPDTEVPYTGGKRAGDFYPSLAVFNDHLYCAWESASEKPLGSTTGDDRDIVWTRFDGESWLEPQELTAPTEQAAEDVYSENPGIKDDYRVQLCTFDNGSGEQLFAIWTANNTGDELFPEERKGDIIISRTIDGLTWTTGFDLTYDDRRYDEDYLPQMIEYETPKGNALFAFWVSNNVANTNGSDWDIVYRFTFDGITWSEQYNLQTGAGITEPMDVTKAIDEDPTLIVYNNQLYVLWRTSNPALGAGEDIDIVISHTTDGFNWSKPKELTLENDILFNNRPMATVHNDNLIVLWRSVESMDAGVIILKIYNKATGEWSEPVRISPTGEGGDDYSPALISFDNKIITAWVTEDNITTRGRDSDVVVRWLIPQNNTPKVALNIGGISEYSDSWLVTKNKFEEGKTNKIDLTVKLQDLLQDNAWITQHTLKDEFKNEVYSIPISTYFSGPGKITLTSLEIQYNYSFMVPDLSVKLSDYLKIQDSDKGNDVQITLRFESKANGKLRVENLKVTYSKPEEPQQFSELICVVILGIFLIIIGLAIKFAPTAPKKPKEPEKD